MRALSGETEIHAGLDPAAAAAAVSLRFVEIEQELDLFTLEAAGVPLWELARVGVHQRVLAALGLMPEESEPSAPHVGARIRSAGAALWNSAFQNPFLARPCDFLFIGHPRRVRRSDARWWDVYCDPVVDSLGERALVLERPCAGIHRRPPHTRRLRYLDIVPVFGAATRRLQKSAIGPALRARITEIEERLGAAFGRPVGASELIAERLALYRSQFPIYCALFRRLRPSVLFVVVGYGNEVPIAAAKSLGIITVELQHGIISPYHLAYAFPPGIRKRAFPDHLFLFGDYWKECARYPIGADCLHSVGFPYYDQERSAVEGVRRKNRVLFLSQWSIGRELSRLASDAARHPGLGGKIIYRLHPAERANWRDEYPWLRDAPLTVVDPAEVPLYRQLAEARVQVGAYSTAIVEGVGMGLATFLANLPGSAALDPLVTSTANVEWYESAEQLIRALHSPPAADAEAAARFFRPGGLAHMHRAIDDILARA